MDRKAFRDRRLHVEQLEDRRLLAVIADAITPAGSLIYQEDLNDSISVAGETDSFTLDLDAGQTLTAVVDPAASLQAEITVVGPGGASVGSIIGILGDDVVLQTVPILASGTYTIEVSGSASTTGSYGLQLLLNAAVENESHDGPSNDTIGSAQDLDPSFIDLGLVAAERGAVLGRGDGGSFTPLQIDFGPSSAIVQAGHFRDAGQAFGTRGESGNLLDYGWVNASGNPASNAADLRERGTVGSVVDGHTVELRDTTFAHKDDSKKWEIAVPNGDYLVTFMSGDAVFNNFTSDVNIENVTLLDPDPQPNPGSNGSQADNFDLFENVLVTVADGRLTIGVASTGWRLRHTWVTIEEAILTDPIPDYYSFSLGAGDSASLAVTSQDSDFSAALELLDAAGTVLATGGVADNVDQTINNFVSPAGGTYYVNVTSGLSDYSLVVTRGADFDTESNSEVGSAQDITLTGTVLGALATGPLPISNPGFDTGDLSDWTSVIPEGGLLEAVSSYVASPADGTTFTPVDGSYFALLKTDGPGSYTTLSQSFVANAGDEISGWAFFDSSESSSAFNDSSEVRILSGSTVVATVFAEDVATVGGPGQTPWTEWSHTFSSAGNFTIEARVTNALDGVVDAYMGLDAVLLSGGDIDFLSFAAVAGDSLTITTLTPGDGPFDFVNTLDPEIEIFDPTGASIAHGNVVGNEAFSQTAALTGIYTVRVFGNDSEGEYVLEVAGNTGVLPPFEVTSTSPADGEHLAVAPLEILVHFSNQVLLTSVVASDLKVDGVDALSVTTIDSNTLQFTLPALVEGENNITIDTGAITNLQNQPLESFASQIVVDTIAPRVVSSSVQEGDIVPAGSLVYTVQFDEELDATNLDATDVQLIGNANGFQSPTLFSYDAGTSTLTLQYDDVPEDQYTLTFFSGDGAFEDLVGNDLDGEPLAFPLPPNMSGDGVEGGNFVVNFDTDFVTSPYPVPLVPMSPLGSLIYDPSQSGLIGTLFDTDSFTIDVDDGQTISVVIETDSSLQAAVQLYNPGNFLVGSASAGTAGQDAYIQTIPTTGAGTYRVAVSGAGGTTGYYSVQIILNAAVEVEEHNGLPNDVRATAQNLDPSFIGLGFGTAERGAVLGRGDGGGGSLSQTQNDNVFFPNVLAFGFNSVGAPVGDGVLTVSTVSDLGSTTEYLTLNAEGLFTQDLFVSDGGEVSFVSTTVNLSQAQLATLLADDGAITFTVTPSSAVDDLGPNYLTLELNYPTAPPTTDLYSFSLAAGESTTLAVTSQGGGNVALELQDAAGTVLAAGIVAGNVDQAINNFVSYAGGTYYANVIAGPSDYSLVVTRDADFDTERNNALDSAQVLGPKLTALGYLSGEAPSGQLGGGAAPLQAENEASSTENEASSTSSSSSTESELSEKSNPNQIIVRFGDLDEMTMLEKIASMGGTLLRELPIINGAVVELTATAIGAAAFALSSEDQTTLDTAQLKEIAKAWETDKSILYAEPDYLYQMTDTLPDDIDFSLLWGMNNTGQTGGTPDADIDAPEAWDNFTGSTSVVIASIDTGVNYNHPDLAPNMWRNLPELNGLPGVDDDGNGYVDDIYGIDTANNDSDPLDDAGHGSHTSGTMGAAGNNGIGVAGVNWDVQIMGLKFLDNFGGGLTSDAIVAIEYMTMMKTDYGINIVASNNSWGGGGFSQALLDAIQASNDAGIMFVTSAGNTGLNADTSPSYPAAYDLDGIISVAATDDNDLLASFSTYGATTVDLGAPGVNVWSTYLGSSYASLSGTSMASPHVAGTVAMLMASDPGASLAEVKEVILASADPIAALDGITVSGGRLNLANALAMLGDPGDYYQFEVQALDNLVLATSTPADGPFGFVNDLDPAIELYDPTGTLVGSDDNSAADERNALLSHVASTGGTYTVRVVSSAGLGEYALNIQGATGSLGAFEVTATDPYDGADLTYPPTQISVDFNDGILLTSFEAADLTLDGIAATGYSILDTGTVVFDLPAGIVDGVHNVAIAAGAILDLQSTPINLYEGTFIVDTVAPRIISTLWNGLPMFASGIYQEGPLTFAALFDEDLSYEGSPFIPDVNDVLLVDHLTETTYTPLTVNYDPATDLFEVGFDSLPEGDYELTLFSGVGGPEDRAGNDFDGEPLGPGFDGTVTGDGVPGGNYTVSFSVDLVSTDIQPWTALEPLGSLIFGSPDNTGFVNTLGDQDVFQFFLEGGQKLTAVLTPTEPSALLSIGLVGLTPTYTASSPGESVALPLVDIPADALFELRVSGDSQTEYDLEIYRNAVVEAMVIDTSEGNPLAVDSSFLALGSGRYGIVGRSDAVLGSAPPITSETEPNDDGVPFGSIGDLLLANDWSGSFLPVGGNQYEATLTGEISVGFDTDWDFFKVLASPGDTLVLDLRGAFSGVGTLFDPYLRLYDNTGTEIAFNDDFNSLESYIEYNSFAYAGDYYVVADSFGGDSGTYELTGVLTTSTLLGSGPAVPDTDFYTLDLSGKAGQLLDVVLSGQDDVDFSTSTLELLDDAGNVLATASSDPLGSGGSAGNFDLGIVGFVVPNVGSNIYTLRFDTELPGEYGIVVTDSLVFNTEPNNDTASTLRNLDDVPTALGWLSNVGEGQLFGSDRDGNLFTIDLQTGAGTLVGALGNQSTEIEFDPQSGRAFTQFSNGLFTGQEFDLETGAAIGAPIFNFGSYNGLEWIGNNLYGTMIIGPGFPSELRVLDPFVGTSTLIGATGQGPISGLAYDAASDTLYGIAGGPGAADLYTIDRNTGVATVVGTTGFQAGSLEFGPDGQLYGGGTGSGAEGKLYRIDPATGASVLVGPTGFSKVTGLLLGPTPELPDDLYTVYLAAGQTLSAYSEIPLLSHPLTEPFNDLDPEITILAPDGTVLATDADSLDGRNALLEITAAAAGDYYVRIGATSGGGEYLLHVEEGPLPADFDGSGTVDGFDFLTWQRGFGTISVATKNDGDSNGDGDVDAQDMQDWKESYGEQDSTPPAAPAVATASTDFDGSGVVDGFDFLTWQRGFGTISVATKNDGDSNGDGDVDAQDLQDWKASYGEQDSTIPTAPLVATASTGAGPITFGTVDTTEPVAAVAPTKKATELGDTFLAAIADLTSKSGNKISRLGADTEAELQLYEHVDNFYARTYQSKGVAVLDSAIEQLSATDLLAESVDFLWEDEPMEKATESDLEATLKSASISDFE